LILRNKSAQGTESQLLGACHNRTADPTVGVAETSCDPYAMKKEGNPWNLADLRDNIHENVIIMNVSCLCAVNSVTAMITQTFTAQQGWFDPLFC